MRKSKSKPKGSAKKQIKRAKRYPAYMLGIVLVLMLLGESSLVLNATPSDWHAGLSVLDMSSGITSMVSDVKSAAEPIATAVDGVNDFYTQSAVAATQLLDASSSSNLTMFVSGVNNFYQQAAQQMAEVLDLSNYTSKFSPQVAGASTYYYK